ncbi:MAG: ribosome-binding factor A [Desulfobulbaceae bacterium DB1]|nr:MAG: ribosome-binding factor A [Desulfobulbaceae bacterium DB1]
MVAAREKSRFTLPEGLVSGPKRRPIRVADAIRNEIAVLFLYKVNDPALREVTIIHVIVSKDLKQAKIYYSCAKEKIKQVKIGLERAKGFIRTHLAGQLQMRHVPELLFFQDKSIDHDEKMQKLFQEIAAENETGTK